MEELLLSLIEELFWTRLELTWMVPGTIVMGGGKGSAVAPLGIIGIVRGDGLGDRSQRAA